MQALGVAFVIFKGHMEGLRLTERERDPFACFLINLNLLLSEGGECVVFGDAGSFAELEVAAIGFVDVWRESEATGELLIVHVAL